MVTLAACLVDDGCRSRLYPIPDTRPFIPDTRPSIPDTRLLLTTIRDPLWNNIGIDAVSLRLIDTPVFQRLRYVRQLGLAYLVYPGATHSRFEHALGTYHLARRTLDRLAATSDASIAERDRGVVLAAALLHDVGHYPFSHALEEIGAPHHEEVARPLILEGTIAGILRQAFGDTAPAEVHALVRGESGSPLQRLISGSLDLDKIEYLKRDALMCGVPYGEIDVERLIESLRIVADPVSGRQTIGIREKGLSALESLLFAKYQMYRNVYWHHAVRSATAMYKRLVYDALRAGRLERDMLASFTDEGLLHHLGTSDGGGMLSALRERRLYKRVFECPAGALSEGAADWVADDHELTASVEDALADEIGVARGSLLLDYPVKTQMLELDIPVLRKHGAVHRLTGEGWDGAINLPRLSEELYRSSRWLRVFSAAPVSLSQERLAGLLTADAGDVRQRLKRGRLL